MRRLVINADDLGFTPAVNRGIFECAEAGSITSASVMVNTPGFDDAMKGRVSLNMGLGLHLNLIDGPPLSKAPSLTNPATGEHWSFAQFLARATARIIRPEDVLAEVTAQFRRLKSAGVMPTHVDSHRHTHVHPVVWPAVLAAAAAEGVGMVRVPREPYELNAKRPRATIAKLLLGVAMHGGASRASARLAGLRTADHFAGISLQASATFAADVVAIIESLQPGLTELVVHPGEVDEALRARDSVVEDRIVEVQALTSNRVRQALEAATRSGTVRLVSFADA